MKTQAKENNYSNENVRTMFTQAITETATNLWSLLLAVCFYRSCPNLPLHLD